MSDQRTLARIHAHYLIERELADRLRTSSREERTRLYRSVYDDLYRRVPDHPQLTRKDTPAARRAAALRQLTGIEPLLTPQVAFLEIGAGDCALGFEVARRVRHVYALDVSQEITRQSAVPSNFSLILSDGAVLPLRAASVTIAYSHQLIEHLHVEDAREHLREVYRILTPGGQYLCMTPNRLTGPHDVSKYFSSTATGLHLKEYTIAELAALLHAAGFQRVRRRLRVTRCHTALSVRPFSGLENVLRVIPSKARRWLAQSRSLEPLLRVELLATKAPDPGSWQLSR